MSTRNEMVKTLIDDALEDDEKLADIVEQLSVGRRRERQIAAEALHALAKENPKRLAVYVDTFVDALNRPEAQTRWECLETLALLVDYDARSCSKAIPEAETALFDEESGTVRLAAVKFLCKIGSTTANRSEKVWPLIDEAIQCYHGDLEFNDMLSAVADFSNGKLSDDVKTKLADRMSFDAENAKGTLKRRAQQIIGNLE